MRFRSHTGLLTAIAVITANTFQFGVPSPALAHHIHVIPPPPPQVIPADNVKDFGATGNGSTDDTLAINNAAADARNNHKGLFFPAGTYLHNSTVNFNGIGVTGAGAGSVLLAGSNTNSAVVLTGANVSIQNLIISTQNLTGGSTLGNYYSASILVQNATSFTVASDTIVQGQGRFGVYIIASSVGAVNACTFDGTGHSGESGVVIDGCYNTSVVGNLFQNVYTGVAVYATAFASQFIAIMSNTIGNVSYPTNFLGIGILGANGVDVSQNTIQLANNTTCHEAILLQAVNNFGISQNNTYGGHVGVALLQPGAGSNIVSQNVIRNCGGIGIATNNLPNSAIQIASNTFGECGLTDTGISTANSVIVVNGSAVSAASSFVQNNSYQGHTNGLNYYITSTFTTPHLPAANVTGNTQSQTALSNSI